jgi:hypothetical protein
MFNPFSALFGWNRKVRKLRKRWDRLREKSLKKDAGMRAVILPKEDQIEQNLRILEERRLNRSERARLAKDIEIDLEEIKAILGSRPEELRPAPVAQSPEMQKVQKQKEQQQAY